MRLGRQTLSLATGYATGHHFCNRMLNLLKKSDTDKCEHCGFVDTLMHRLADCFYYMRQRQKVFGSPILQPLELRGQPILTLLEFAKKITCDK